MPPYALPGHVFACLDGNHVVLLDLREDRYFALEATSALGVHSIVQGWPLLPASVVEAAKAVTAEHAVQTLIEKGLVSLRSADALPHAPARTCKPTRELTDGRYEDSPRLSIGKVWAFCASTASAALVLRFCSLERVVTRVKRRNQYHGWGDPDCVRQPTPALIAAFAKLRPFLFSWRDACLFESLVLSEFLARHGVFPQWVFGVQARPFSAHCWLQWGDIVLNDTLARVTAYTPIMAV